MCVFLLVNTKQFPVNDNCNLLLQKMLIIKTTEYE